jgi:hypothetical protein
MHARIARPIWTLICVVGAALSTTSCIHVGYRYDFVDAVSPQSWGQVLIRLVPRTSYYRDGVSMMKGPYGFVAAVWITDGAALPQTCKAHFSSTALVDSRGRTVLTIPSQDVAPRVSEFGTPDKPRPDPSGRAIAGVHGTADVPHQDYVAIVDVRLEGCGAIDGSYPIRETLKSRYEKRHFNPGFEALMGV